jgi:hypothetical protein
VTLRGYDQFPYYWLIRIAASGCNCYTGTDGFKPLVDVMSLFQMLVSSSHSSTQAVQPRAKKVITNNKSSDESWMQSTPFADNDIYKDKDVIITNNISGGNSTMMNAGIS